MATQIYVGNSHGCEGRCDEAAEAERTCICGGRNHGVGLEQALINTAEIVDGGRPSLACASQTPWYAVGVLGGLEPLRSIDPSGTRGGLDQPDAVRLSRDVMQGGSER